MQEGSCLHTIVMLVSYALLIVALVWLYTTAGGTELLFSLR